MSENRTGDRPRIGAVLASVPHREIVTRAQSLQACGVDAVWLVEDCFQYGAISAAAAVLGATSQLRVGVGLFPVAVRNAAIFAMELATIAEMFPGRLTVGLGHGVETWMRQIDARPPDRLVALREVLVATRRLLDGERVTVHGRFVRLDGVELEQPPTIRPPLLVGTTGPRGIALAADQADGLLLPEGASPTAVRWASEQLGLGRRLIVYSWLRIDDDEQRALAALAPALARWNEMQLYAQLAKRAALDADGLAARVALAGSPATCVSHTRELMDAGADEIVLLAVGPDPQAQVQRFMNDVAPLIG